MCSVVIFMHSALSPWLVFILAPSAKSRLASWALQSVVLLGAGSPSTGLWFLPLARHIAAYRCSGTSDSWGRSKRLMVFGPLFPSFGLPNSVISKCLQPSIRLSLPLLSCPFPSRLPNAATGLRGSLVHVSPRFCILRTMSSDSLSDTSVSLAVSRSPRTWPTRRRIPSQTQFGLAHL